ncbi:hypothetical protein TRVA0_026S01926 [Trichomonascus vanleenenianus]|uniref:Mcm21p n=1 Tax=Trichomonascus vanleenenianus TaxID=2268995 RepID=UPI003EC9B41C
MDLEIGELEKDIAQYEFKVEELRREYEKKCIRTFVGGGESSSPEGVDLLGRIEKRRVELDLAVKENLDRMTGITYFNVADFDGFGIRFEVFARRSFRTPHYVILKKEDKGGRLDIHQHTIPAFIPLGTYKYKYLNGDIQLFAESVYRDLNRLERRRAALESLKGITSVGFDPAVRIVRIGLGDDEVQLVCSDTEVVSVDGAEGPLLHAILGSLDGLPERMALYLNR